MDSSQLATLLAQYPFRTLADPSGKVLNQIISCPVRLSFCGVDKFYPPSKKYPNRPSEASVTAVIPPGADITPLQLACRGLATSHFGELLNSKKIMIPDGKGGQIETTLKHTLKWPWKSQSQKAGSPGFSSDGSGFWFRAGCNATFPDGSPRQLPRVIDAQKNQIPNDSPEIYSGMWARVLLRIYAYPAKITAQTDFSIAGINVGLVQIQKIGDDDRLSTAGANDEAFEVMAHVGSQPSNTSGAGPANLGGGDGW